jgi:copper homeostasis protein
VKSGDPSVLVEACVDSVASSVAAERGGAQRVELCDALFDGGTTPSAGMIAACREAVSIPLFVMIRPRGGSFVYSGIERDVMRRDAIAARELGADGLVFGGLLTDGSVDVTLVSEMKEAAQGLPLTFHRAFDFSHDLEASLESIAEAGVERLLTSGGAATAAAGAEKIAELVRQAGTRVIVVAGGGIREENVQALISLSGVREVHVRLTRLRNSDEESVGRELRVRKQLPNDETAWDETDSDLVERFVRTIDPASRAE